MFNSRTLLLSALLPVILVAGCEKEQASTDQPQTTEQSAATVSPTPPVQAPATDSGLSTDQQKLSYAIGVQIGQNLTAQALDIEQDAFIQGILDTVTKVEPKLTVEQMEQAVSTYLAQEQQKQIEIAQQNLAAGEAFLAANKKNADVTETASGLQYKVLTKGTGVQPKATDSVVVHYKGTFIDGTEFDSSYGRGEPMTISLGQVIPAWQEVVPMMPVGSKWQVYIPSKLGYGEMPSGPIPPNSTLIFDVELLSVAEAPAPAMTPVP